MFYAGLMILNTILSAVQYGTQKRVADAPKDMVTLRDVNLALRSQGMRMDKSRMKRFMDDQIEEIKKHKQLKDKEAGKDLGDRPIYEWIESQSEDFRKKWEERNS